MKSDGAVTIGQTTVNSPAGIGINLEDNVPGFAADFGVTTVSAPGAEGVRIVNATDPKSSAANGQNIFVVIEILKKIRNYFKLKFYSWTIKT